LYRQTATELGHNLDELPLSINSHGFIADSHQEAIDVSFPSVQVVMNKIGRERGWPPMQKEQYEAAASLRGSNFVGSPDEVIEKILFQHEIFGHQRFGLQLSVGSMPHDKLMHAIELFGTKVAPVVKAEIAKRTSKEKTTSS
jgi:alkanesulfonate monooxygenase SsuD/methylene tetrahydromethanopterin reductase-like flavin-dependent oxidoreductase (luciferase family)